MSEIPDGDFELVMIPAFAMIIMADDIPDRLRELRFLALQRLWGYLNHYRELGYVQRLLYRIAEKKSEMILKAGSKSEVERLLKPQCPHYNGVAFIPDQYHVPEEELICWSETSLRGPLADAGFQRYRELFRSIFPEESKSVFPGKEAADE